MTARIIPNVASTVLRSRRESSEAIPQSTAAIIQIAVIIWASGVQDVFKFPLFYQFILFVDARLLGA